MKNVFEKIHSSKFLKLAITYLVIAFTLCYTEKGEQYISPEDFLIKQKTIRVCIGNGPNFGDQASTMNVMARLRQLGFQGDFEVIYDKQKSLQKIVTLFGLPRNIPTIYKDKQKKIIFFEYNTFEQLLKKHAIQLINLGISVGKADYLCDANSAYTKLFTQFSPYLNDKRGWHNATYIEIFGQSKKIQQTDISKKYFIFPIADYDQAKYFLKNDPVGKELLIKKPALRTFLTGMEKQKYNILPIYGRTLRFKDQADPLNASPSPSNILQTIAGARYAQLMGPAELRKPLIIVIFDNYKQYAQEVLILIKRDNWGGYEQAGAKKAREVIRNLSLRSAFSVADISDAETISKIKSLKPGEILLLSMGFLPKTVFDALYTHNAQNIWPQVYEGAGTFSILAFSNKPRFECADTSSHLDKDLPHSTWTAGFELIKNPKLKQDMQNFYNSNKGYCSSTGNSNLHTVNFMSAWENNMYQTMGQFIIAAHDPSSSFSHYFVELNHYVLKLENDRVHYALEDIVKVLNSKK